jgi:hypothetical protein
MARDKATVTKPNSSEMRRSGNQQVSHTATARRTEQGVEKDHSFVPRVDGTWVPPLPVYKEAAQRPLREVGEQCQPAATECGDPWRPSRGQ